MEPSTTPGSATDLERRKVEIDEMKVEMEFDRIKIEKMKAWTGSLSTFGSLLVVAGTIAIGIWSQYEQAKLQYDIQDRQAKAQFELKAAEIVLSTDNPGVTLNKAKAIQALFPQYLSADFADSFVPQSFARSDEVANNNEADKIKLVNYKRSAVSNKPALPGVEEFSFVPAGKKRAYKKRVIRAPTPLPVDPYNPEEGVADPAPANGNANTRLPDRRELPPKPTPTP